MKLIIIIALVLCMPGLTRAQEQGIRFDKSMSWREVVEKATRENKYIYVDVMATWCGPCRGAIASFEPRKNKFKDKDVVFVYITNESSPESKWLEMVAGIEGDHYRLNRKQWDYICDYFGVDGIPSYVIVDRDGNARLRNDLRGSGMLEQELAGML